MCQLSYLVYIISHVQLVERLVKSDNLFQQDQHMISSPASIARTDYEKAECCEKKVCRIATTCSLFQCKSMA